MSTKAAPGGAWSQSTKSLIAADRPTLDEMAGEALARPGRLRIAPRGDLEILFARTFAAPPAAVFHAWTDPSLARQWLGAPGFPVIEAASDPVPGGAYHYAVADPAGRVMGWAGTFGAVTPDQGFRATERSDPAWYPGATQVALELRAAAGGSVALITYAYESLPARTLVLRSPMDAGLAAGLDRLAALVERAPPG
ncbi:SRPBCC domain-containing protein [Xanthobacter tagetidis]|jgi:uncharacterized protein YndB with AHSA1/START domain|uniref:Activator of Hsp90 ATPase homologue 1/2-like C-terminal domain-containing protein n=1 Tax=Xanthobacter tagetidis TaxID=60216 RepID=A0A3L7AND7_9HYPH|nr:SRPBCC domain-containing protein [Xanthobacter tagetidis]MBB6307592.1 uncharacterized protein YndB with AHSA1/START domain [Xanthobacter tagetidis]RLP81160.1 hypothetical protein D9R14_03995 [Xanthobacter tagetidis]